jgi:hypothetical protein
MPAADLPGAKLTEDILAAVAPLVDGLPVELVTEAMAAAMMMTVTVGCASADDQGLVLRRYADRLNAIADMLEDNAHARGQPVRRRLRPAAGAQRPRH